MIPYQGSAFGLAVYSAFPLPELRATRRSPSDDKLTASVLHRESIGCGWQCTIPPAYCYENQVELIADTLLRVYRTASAPDSIVRLLMLGVGLSLALHQRGTQVLHGSAVRLPAGVVAVVGPSGVGKSTLTAALLQRGGTLVSDDVCALDGRSVRAGFGRIKLWDDAAAHFGYSVNDLPRVHPLFDKRSIEVPCEHRPHSLNSVVVLRRGSTLSVRAIQGNEAMSALLANHRLPEVVHGAAWLLAVQALVSKVPVWELTLPGPLNTVDAAAELVVQSLQG